MSHLPSWLRRLWPWRRRRDRGNPLFATLRQARQIARELRSLGASPETIRATLGQIVRRQNDLAGGSEEVAAFIEAEVMKAVDRELDRSV